MKNVATAMSVLLLTVIVGTFTLTGVSYASNTNLGETAELQQVTAVTVNTNTIPGTSDQWVTPDGRYVLGKYTNDSGEYLEDMQGRKYRLPPNLGFIGRSTPNGDVIMESMAGGTEDVLVFRPGTGVIKRFPDDKDPFAKGGVRAQESVKGHWFQLVSEITGAEPMQEWWLDVDGRTIPLLNGATQAAWAPNGVDLATVLPFDTTKHQGWLTIYNEVQQRRELLGMPVTLPQETPFMPVAPNIQWSSDGKWLALRTADGLEVSYVPKGTGDATSVSFHYPTAMWGWASNDRLFSVETGKDTSTVRYFQLRGQTWKVVSQVSLTGLASSYHITRDERQLFHTDEGDIYLVDGKHEVRLIRHANIWWYNVANDHVYFGTSNTAINSVAKIYRLPVPHSIIT